MNEQLKILMYDRYRIFSKMNFYMPLISIVDSISVTLENIKGLYKTCCYTKIRIGRSQALDGSVALVEVNVRSVTTELPGYLHC